MDHQAVTPSLQLQAANRRLQVLRGAVRAQHRATGRLAPPPLSVASQKGQQGLLPPVTDITALPAHLGWASAAVTHNLRAWRQRSLAANSRATALAWLSRLVSPECKPPEVKREKPGEDRPEFVKVYPDIALGMLRQEQAAAGRIWLLLQHLDEKGQGWLRIVYIRQYLTHKPSAYRVCGWRQLRNLLRQGEGIFWHRDKTRIWMRSAAKVAGALGVERLTGRPVAMQVAVLLGGIGEVRAHLYASFHAGRGKESGGERSHKPIARATLERLSGVTPQGQRLYEKQIGITVEHNFAVGEQMTADRWQERAWQRGRGVFELVDHQGQQGRKGRIYLAWQLPNSYHCAHEKRPKGQQKRINRKLIDLVMKGMPGNDEETNGTQELSKQYFPNGKLAAIAHSRNPEGELYWRRHRTRKRGLAMWQAISR